MILKNLLSSLISFNQIAVSSSLKYLPKIYLGIIRMHWHYYIFGRGRGLNKFLPLDRPLKVHVDPASGCNFKCFFCPQSEPESLKISGVPSGVMKIDLFKKLIDDFYLVNYKISELVLGNYGEPLINKNISEMVAYAKNSSLFREISIITNIDLMTPELAEKLVLAGLDKIRISIEALSTQKYKETTGVDVDFDNIVRKVSYIYEASVRNNNKTFVYVKILDIDLKPADKRKFFEIFTPISHSISIENLMPVTEKAVTFIKNNQKGMTGTPLARGRKVCPAPFYTLSVHVNGDVGVCCSDWYHKATVGSIKTNSIIDIWNGHLFSKFRVDQLKNSWYNLEACEGCTTADHYPVFEDLDSFKDDLLKKYEALNDSK